MTIQQYISRINLNLSDPNLSKTHPITAQCVEKKKKQSCSEQEIRTIYLSKYEPAPPPLPQHLQKKPQSSYFQFAKERRPILKKKHPVKPGSEITSIISQEWKGMKDEEQQKYYIMAKKLKDEYDGNMKKFEKTEGYKIYESKLSEWEKAVRKYLGQNCTYLGVAWDGVTTNDGTENKPKKRGRKRKVIDDNGEEMAQTPRKKRRLSGDNDNGEKMEEKEENTNTNTNSSNNSNVTKRNPVSNVCTCLHQKKTQIRIELFVYRNTMKK